MAPLNTATVLQRKVAPNATAPAPPRVLTPGQALTRVWSRCVSDQMPLVVQNVRVTTSQLSLAEALDTVEEDGFAALLGDGGDGYGLFGMDQQGFSALVEAMTIGRLAQRPSGQRRPTATDAALLAALIDRCLAALPAPPDAPQAREGDALLAALSASRFDRQIADHRLLPILLEEGRYDLLGLSGLFVCGAVERGFSLTLLIPHRSAAPTRTPPDTAPEQDPWAQALARSVMAAPTQLCAELGRIPMTVSRLTMLKPGDCLTLPLSALEDIVLRDLQGRALGQGRLGQSRGMRALRLTSNLADAAGGDAFQPPLSLPDWPDSASATSNVA